MIFRCPVPFSPGLDKLLQDVAFRLQSRKQHRSAMGIKLLNDLCDSQQGKRKGVVDSTLMND